MNIEGERLPEPRMPSALVNHYATIVRRHAFRMLRRLPSHVEVEDLISAGFLGLADALKRAELSPSDHFQAYAEFRIRGAMLDELRSRDPLSRDLRSLSKKVTSATATLTVELGRLPDEIEIAERIGLPVAKFRVELAKLAIGGFVSMDTGGAEGDGIELGDEGREAADSSVLRSERREKLASLVQQLPARLQELLRLSFEQDYTLREIGDQLGVTESRACQLHAEAILQLRAAYVADDAHDEGLPSVRPTRMRKHRSASTARQLIRRSRMSPALGRSQSTSSGSLGTLV